MSNQIYAKLSIDGIFPHQEKAADCPHAGEKLTIG